MTGLDIGVRSMSVRYHRRAIYRDTYRPGRRLQRGQTPGAAGWVLKLPHGSLWLMLLGDRPRGWVHKEKR